MQVVITAVGPDNRGLADPIVHHVASAGANIAEIQMYDHDAERLFAMLLRLDWPPERGSVADLRTRMNEIGRDKGLSVRTWSRDETARPPRLALCVTYRPEPPLADAVVVPLLDEPRSRESSRDCVLSTPGAICRVAVSAPAPDLPTILTALASRKRSTATA